LDDGIGDTKVSIPTPIRIEKSRETYVVAFVPSFGPTIGEAGSVAAQASGRHGRCNLHATDAIHTIVQ
jgi:hypothetical protein